MAASKRAKWSWGTGLAGALAAHVVLILAAVLTTKIPSPTKEPPSFVLRLVQPWRPPPEPERRPPPQSRIAPAALPTPAPTPRAAPSPVPTAPAQSAPTTGPSPGDIAAVRNILRGTLGCSNARLYRLTPEEQAHCDKLLQARLDPNNPPPPMIDPVKRTWFEASLRARLAGQHMPMGPPGLGNAAMRVAGAGANKGAHDIKIGPLNVGLPPGAFNDDDVPPP
jgi:hypothetical protein